MNKLILLCLLLLSLNTIAQNPLDNPIGGIKDTTCINENKFQISKEDSILFIGTKIEMLEKENHEVSNALRLYGIQNVTANYISIISFSTVILGTILGAQTSQILLVTGLCDFATLIITGHAARKLAHRKLK